MDVPPLAEINDSALYAVGAAAAFMIGYGIWDFVTMDDITSRHAAAGAAWIATALGAPAKLGWPADSSFILGGGACGVVLVVGRLLGWR